jgi:hypothetical protein
VKRSLRLAMAAAFLVAFPGTVGACSAIGQGPAVPGCGSVERLALVAQSVPSAAYVPCLNHLPAGWTASGFEAASGHAGFTLRSNLASRQPVVVRLAPTCDVSGATPTPPRAPGVSTYTELRSISPLYAGTLSDVFSGGCITYRFGFERGQHIALIEDFESAVALYPRQELSVQLHRQLGVTLGP